MTEKKRPGGESDSLSSQSRRLRDAMVWLIRGFVLYDPRKNYPDFYLSPQQSYVINVISEEERITPGEVAKILRLEKSHLTKIVNSLIDLGAVQKVRDEEDRRRQYLTLTGKGREIYGELDKVSVQSYENFVKHIPEKDRERVIESTEAMLKAVEEMRREMDEGE
ncbi:MAG TPA: MarR family transcriptional regulator [bacterium]|jgi:DNA-binding MarR family transcriptional regulator